jgi:hypothetical protein
LLAYRLNQRRLLCLRIRQGGLYGQNLLIELDGIFEELRGVPRTSYSLYPPFADRELKDCLSRALRRRGFSGTNTAAELAALADRGINR